MAKSLCVRPSWSCLKLCQGKPLSALLLAEILYRANVTKYSNGDDPVVAFSHDEWADITGLSVNQVRKGLAHLTDLDLVRTYNAHHPFKPALRALHIEVPSGLALLHSCLAAGDYRYDGDELCAPKLTSLIRLGVSIAHSSCQIGAGGEDTLACAQGTDLSYSNKEKKEELVAAEKDSAAFEEDQEDQEDQESRIRLIPTLSYFLAELHDNHMMVHQAMELRKSEKDFHALDAGKVWAACMKEHWGEFASITLLPRDYAQFKRMIHELGKDNMIKIIEQTIKGWANFVDCVMTKQAGIYAPNAPKVSYVYYYRSHAMNLYCAPTKLKSYSEWQQSA